MGQPSDRLQRPRCEQWHSIGCGTVSGSFDAEGDTSSAVSQKLKSRAAGQYGSRLSGTTVQCSTDSGEAAGESRWPERGRVKLGSTPHKGLRSRRSVESKSRRQSRVGAAGASGAAVACRPRLAIAAEQDLWRP